MQIAYDSDNVDDIPTQAEIYAYYQDGEPGSASPEQLARHPGKGYSITRKPGVKAYWMDVEFGAATVDDFIEAFKAGEVHGIYIQESRVTTELEPKAVAANVTGYDLWSASWGSAGLTPGAVWTQFASPTSNPPTGGHFDTSYVWSGWIPKGEQGTVTDTPTVDADGDMTLAAPIVAASPTPSGNGYYLFGADGGVFNFGDAQLYKDGEDRVSLGGVALHKPIVAGFCSKSGAGYTMVAADGGVFNFGDAAFHGSI